jgi:hypothetical protein
VLKWLFADVLVKGHKWKEVIHNNKVTWLATWTENIQARMVFVGVGVVSRSRFA